MGKHRKQSGKTQKFITYSSLKIGLKAFVRYTVAQIIQSVAYLCLKLIFQRVVMLNLGKTKSAIATKGKP